MKSSCHDDHGRKITEVYQYDYADLVILSLHCDYNQNTDIQTKKGYQPQEELIPVNSKCQMNL